MTNRDQAGRRLGRRQFLGATAAASTMLVLPPARAQSKGHVTFFSYATLTDRKLTGEFPKQSGIELRLQNFGTVDQMVGKLKATGGSDMDVVNVPSSSTQQLFADGLLEPVDVSRLKHWGAVYPAFKTGSFIQTGMPGKVIGVPTLWGPEGLMYRTDKVKPQDSWLALWDKEYKGRIGAIDYGYEMVLVGAQVLGFTDGLKKNPIDFTDQQYDAIKAKLIEQKDVVAKYWSTAAEGGRLMAGGEIWLSLGRLSILETVRKEGLPFRMIAPKEGAQGWCTSSCIVKTSKNKDAAYEFLDYLTGEVYQNALATRYPVANMQIMDALPEERRKILMLEDPKLLDSMVFWNQAANPQRINTLWNEVKVA